MKQRHSGLTSSQQTPKAYTRQEYRYKRGMHSHMFIEDFCRSFSIQLAPFEKHDEFYAVAPPHDLLEKLLLFDDYSFFRYSFEKLLDSLMYNLILNGKAYLEIVKWTDESGDLKGLEFIPIYASRGIKLKGFYHFKVKTSEGCSKFKIEEQNLVVFDLKKLGFRRKYFRRLINKMSRFDLLGLTDLPLDKTLNGIYDFTEHKKRQELRFLKLTKNIYWFGRNHSNQHLSESYLLYREAYFAILQHKFLDYMLERINYGLEPLRQEFGFNGKLVVSLPRIDYKKHLQSYNDGEINASQLCDIILKKIEPPKTTE